MNTIIVGQSDFKKIFINKVKVSAFLTVLENIKSYLYFYLVLQEFAKEIHNFFRDVFDLNGYVIVFTSNLNRKSFGEKLPPELKSRFDIKSEFLSLSLEDKEYYLSLKLQQLISKLNIEDKESLVQEIEKVKIYYLD